MSDNIAQNILDAVEIIVEKRMSELKFDRTIQAMIVKPLDPLTGEYQVRYQDSLLTAYCPEPKTLIYKEGQAVYVLVPFNDLTERKTIIGLTSGSVKDALVSSWQGPREPYLTNEPAGNWYAVEMREAHLGDTYKNTLSGLSYVFEKNIVLGEDVYSWKMIPNQANTKKRIFIEEPVAPYDIGDLWFTDIDADLKGDMKICVIPKSEDEQANLDEDWVLATKYTGDEAVSKLIFDLGSDQQLTPIEKNSVLSLWIEIGGLDTELNSQIIIEPNPVNCGSGEFYSLVEQSKIYEAPAIKTALEECLSQYLSLKEYLIGSDGSRGTGILSLNNMDVNTVIPPADTSKMMTLFSNYGVSKESLLLEIQKASKSLYDEYFSFDDDQLVIGKEGQAFSTRISGSALGFYEGGTEVASISNQKLKVVDASVANEMSVGRFAFISRTNGNLSFVYVGPEGSV